MKLFVGSVALILSLALGGVASAHDKHKPAAAAKTTKGKVVFIGKGDGVTTCPVTGEEIPSKDVKAVMFGRTVYFCCEGCMADAKKTPAAYVKPSHRAQLAAIKNLPKTEDHHAGHHAEPQTGEQAFLGKGDGIETCPVTGEAVSKSLKGEVNGREFYVCCEGCIATVKKNPSAYLKPVQEAKKETAFLGKGDGVETCPVTGEPVDKNMKGEVNGQTFYVCCEGCIDTVKKNPDAYLKKAEKK
jgi:YHS domain-containing protein